MESPPDFMLIPPPPPPPHLQDLCHYEGDCSHQPVISDVVSGVDSVMHIISLILITSLTIIIVFAVSCIIVYRYVITVSKLFLHWKYFRSQRRKNSASPSPEDLYREVNSYSTTLRDGSRGHQSDSHFNYYVTDSAGEHIYEVIDDECCDHKTQVYHVSSHSDHGHVSPPQSLVRIKFDQLQCPVKQDNYRHFNSLKTFRTHKTRDFT